MKNMRTDALQAQAITDATKFEEQVKLSHEVAELLRKNVVQAYKAPEQPTSGEELWQIQLRDGIEMGDNDTIKSPPPLELNSRRARKQEKEFNSADAASPKPVAPRFYSALKKAHQQRTPPELNEDDLDETFVRDRLAFRRTANLLAVYFLKRRVSIYPVYDQEEPHQLILPFVKLDKIENPGLSKGDLQRAKHNERERRRRKKAKKKALKQERDAIFAPSDKS
ncbi:hypothetical protein HWV62_33585 [Athelia sp. TMB]|nr:hypothetical protein HWV62_33585 [Athelia sp. TMB]